MTLNDRAWRLVEQMVATAAELRVDVHTISGGARLIDAGVRAQGGLQAGLLLARVCLADAAEVKLAPGEIAGIPCPHVQVITDHPIAACLASQYAGWRIAVGKFFAMGSGPMRAQYAKEELFAHIPDKEQATEAVGVLEAGKLPDDAVIDFLSERLHLPVPRLALLVAPTASIAGTVQVVARSLETALHKLHELKFDLSCVVSGSGTAPLPPVAADQMQAIGWTNDAILYGGRVALWVQCEDDVLAELGPKVPSGSSRDHGAPFATIFERYNRDFYQIDPLLFSPAQIVFFNLKTGRTHTFGATAPDVMGRSFFGTS